MIRTTTGDRSPLAVLHPSVTRHPRPDRLPIVYYVTNAMVSPEGMPQVVKIGSTVDLPERMLRMQRRYPDLLARLVAWHPGDERTESRLHATHRRRRVTGADWYWLAGELLDAMHELTAEGLAGDDPWR